MTDCMIQETTTQTGFFAGFVSYLKTRAQQRRNRAAFQNLLTLDPAILKDIGVKRGDVLWANSLPKEINAAQELEKIKVHSPMTL